VPNEYSGSVPQQPTRFAVVVSEYNRSITAKLLDGAVTTLTEHGIPDDQIDVAWVPGAWEIPVVAARLVRGGSYDAVISLGAVIRGETTHDQYINDAVSRGLSELALETGVPMLFGVLTCNTLEQAIHRSGGNQGNKGVESAEAALKVVDLLAKLP
jgi:6,7-dimethyl-8-ribityllumazine synthase